jgi:peptide/nickel transport system ATP-binding protein
MDTAVTPSEAPLLQVRGLRTHVETPNGVLRILDGVDLTVGRGRTVCIVGESGCGKSMTARSIIRLVPPPVRMAGGEIVLHRPGGETIDLAGLDPFSPTVRAIRGRDIGMIFQEPMTALSPVHTIGNQMAEAIRLHERVSRTEARNRSIEMLRRVGLPRPADRLGAYSFQLSGGMRQRAMIAMALLCGPGLLIADEPTTALDVTTQAQILDLMRELRAGLGMSILFITHDLGVVAEMADEVVVMYLGKVVERGSVAQVFHDPRHPYTRALLRSNPGLDDAPGRRLRTITGTVPDPLNRPPGCPFHSRCEEAIAGRCDRIDPEPVVVGPGHAASCLIAETPPVRQPAATGATRGPAATVADGTLPAAPVVAPATPRAVPAVAPATPGATPGAAPVAVPAAAPATASMAVSAAPAATPGATPGTPAAADTALLRLEGLSMHFSGRRSFLRPAEPSIRAVNELTLSVRPGETMGLVGESGCGKTTTGRCIIRTLQPTGGRILYHGEDGATADLAHLPKTALRPYRRQIRMIFQDPYSSLDPRMTVGDIIGEPLKVNHVARGRELRDRVENLIRRVGLRPEYIRRYPHAFSGGERQRIGIARALSLDPRLVICDEAVSALDVSVQAQILNLLRDLQDELRLTYVFIAHDLSVVRHICDRVAVMYAGRIVELGRTAEVFAAPRHPYTSALLSAAPVLDPDERARRQRVILAGEVPDPARLPAGCPFHPRCPHSDGKRCATEVPVVTRDAAGREVACHYADRLDLPGVGRRLVVGAPAGR